MLFSSPLAGKDPRQAVQNFIRPINEALSCVTAERAVASGDDPGEVQALSLQRGALAKLQTDPALFLTVLIRFHIRRAKGKRGPWKVSTVAYYYGIHDSDGREVLAYHWHPGVGPTYPHLHFHTATGSAKFLSKAHIPTRRISLEEVLRFLIEQLGAKPRRSNWREILAGSQERYESFRSWG